jgi:hypothetical protein
VEATGHSYDEYGGQVDKAIGIVLYKNWSTIWGGISDIIHDVWNWIATYWPFLLPILLGPIGVVALVVIKNFGTIKAVVMDVWHWIADNWPLLLAILTGPFGIAIYFIVTHWNALMGFFKGIPGDMRSIFDSIWGGIGDAFRAVINWVIDLWNRLHFKLPSIHFGPINIDGPDIGVPNIAHLATGGIVTAPTLALLGERGPEAVVPLNRGRTGPAVHIDNVNLHDQADIGLLLAQIHFATMAGRL